ncbi:MAG TPA: SPOR domain-containing protein [candidate division Zixibacteria bacterium]|nr:SPOR domain-containing protein [candidate division Zixibacteria bacterium]
MRDRRYIILFLLLLLAFAGCSKKKEEAKKLQNEMMQRDTVTDTVLDTVTAMMPDTTRMRANAGAVPSDEMPSQYMPRQPQGEGYTVQVASTTGENDAHRLIDLYTKRGYEPYVTKTDIDGVTYYRIRIGQFQTLSEAKQLKTELSDRFSVKGWIDDFSS